MRQNRPMETIEPVTDRQLEVARLVAEGRSNPEIADALGVSLAGAKYHVSELLGRLGVSSREEIAAWYANQGRTPSTPLRRHRRIRALAPIGAVLGGGVAAALVFVALAGGRDDSALPIATSEPPPAAVATERGAVPTGTDSPSEVVDYCWLGAWEPGIWPAREGMLRPGYFPDGWRVYTVGGGPTDWDDPASDCSFDQLQITLAPLDAPPIESGEAVEDWIVFSQTPFPDPTPDLSTDQPITLGDGRVAYRSIEDGTERLAWERDGIVALLVSPSVPFTELVWIADSTVLEDTSPTLPNVGPTAGDLWVWPVDGELERAFGPEHPEGIDILAPLDTEVRAARAGEVTFAGGDPCCDEGYHVIIQHEDGYETLYGHLGSFARQAGALVVVGDVIGTVETTGETDEPHLHFELHRNGVFQDPQNFLP